jgi:MoxR-like ATPase
MTDPGFESESEYELAALREAGRQVGEVIAGQHRVLERLWSCLLSEGHALLEGVPGVGKTAMLTAMSQAVGCSFSRIQFTADLMPSDILGTRIYRSSSESFTVEKGPIFANFVLADEVNRAPAKVQSALLEVMAEAQVTLAGQTMRVPSPFLVLATQNPIDSEGTYSLPEAQRDRFMMRIMVEYPTPEEEWEVMNRHAVPSTSVNAVMTADQLRSLQRRARTLPVDEAVARYALDLVLATRYPHRFGLDHLDDQLAYGASPRASLALLRSARGLALLRGRPSVTPQEIYDVAFDVLNHRLVLSYRALADGIGVQDVLRSILTTVKAPLHPAGRLVAGSTSTSTGNGWQPPAPAPLTAPPDPVPGSTTP